MSFNRLCLVSVFAAPLVLVTALWAFGVLPAVEAWRWKTALVIHVDPVAVGLMFFGSLIFTGKALDMIRAYYAAAGYRPRH